MFGDRKRLVTRLLARTHAARIIAPPLPPVRRRHPALITFIAGCMATAELSASLLYSKRLSARHTRKPVDLHEALIGSCRRQIAPTKHNHAEVQRFQTNQITRFTLQRIANQQSQFTMVLLAVLLLSQGRNFHNTILMILAKFTPTPKKIDRFCRVLSLSKSQKMDQQNLMFQRVKICMIAKKSL